MRSSKSRSRSKSNRPRTLGNIVNRVFDSSGPEGKVRGTPQQIIDKYLVLARDAQLSNDRVAAENFLQHAEHYTRMLNEAQREMARESGGEYRRDTDGMQARNGNGGDSHGQPRADQHPQRNGDGQSRGEQQQQQPRNGDGGQPRDQQGRNRIREREDDREDRATGQEAAEQPRRPRAEPRPAPVADAAQVIDFDAESESVLVETPEAGGNAAPREQPSEALQGGGGEAPAEADSEAEADKPRPVPRRRAPRKPRESKSAGEAAAAPGEPRSSAAE